MIIGSELRSHLNRKVTFEGDWRLDVINKDGILLPMPSIAGTVQEGDTLLIVCPTTVQVTGRVLAVSAHPALYDHGVVTHLPYIDSGMGPTRLQFRFEADVDFDLATLPYLCKLYMLGTT